MVYPVTHAGEHIVMGIYNLSFGCAIFVIIMVVCLLSEYKKRLKEKDHGWERWDGLLYPGWKSDKFDTIAYDKLQIDELITFIFELLYRDEESRQASAVLQFNKFPKESWDRISSLADSSWKRVKSGEDRKKVANDVKNELNRLIGENKMTV